MKKNKIVVLPSVDEMKEELQRIKHKKRFGRAVKSTVYTLLVVAAVSILVSMLWGPVFRIHGSSMEPALSPGDIAVGIKTTDIKQGDITAFYYNNKILIKRAVAFSGDWIDIDENGKVLVNQVPLDEPYVKIPALGDTDIKLPYQVPDGKIFVMGDNRESSLDSRNKALGCIAEEQIIGRIFFGF